MTDDPILLKKRAKARLIGAIAFAIILAVFVPMLFDKEPRQVVKDVNLPPSSQEEKGASSKINPIRITPPGITEIKTPPKNEVAQEIKPTPPAHNKSSETGEKNKTETAVSTSNAASNNTQPSSTPLAANSSNTVANMETKSERALVEALLGSKEAFVVQLGVFADKHNANQLLSRVIAVGFKPYTDSVELAHKSHTRVRIGPYPTKEEAEKIQSKLKAMGFNGKVTLASK